MKRGKKYIERCENVNKEILVAPFEAVDIIKKGAFANFDETIEVHFNLGIDPRHADQMVRGTLMLPHGTGKKIRVVAIAQGDKAQEAKTAGVDEVGGDELIEKIQSGWLDFDIVVTTPDMMSKVGKLGRILGARGMMPSPKSGTVTNDLGVAIKDIKAGKIEYRNDKTGIVHIIIGKASFEAKNIAENFETAYDILLKAKPPKAKGVYFKSIVICSTMGPGIKLETVKTKWKEKG